MLCFVPLTSGAAAMIRLDNKLAPPAPHMYGLQCRTAWTSPINSRSYAARQRW
uniref:Uncharacterized protein n=1 Tax=Arundo donax TaxID=35708 RepID=A0A0A9BDZ1_ARUDO